MINFELLDQGRKYGLEIESVVGDIKYFADESDARPLKEQFHERYSFGGGWNPIKGFTMMRDNRIAYPGDTALKPLASALFRDQVIYVYPYAWVAIVEKDGTFEVSRMD